MPRILLAGSVSLIALTAAAHAETTRIVQSAPELQSALDALVETGGTVVLNGDAFGTDTTMTYAGTAPLTLLGQGQTIRMRGAGDVFAVTQGADLTVSGVNFTGPGGYSIMAQAGDVAGKGLFVAVPEDADGTVTMMLNDVTVSDVANHGIHISDCTLADACGSGGGGAGDGSAASVHLHMTNVLVDAVGLGSFDADGVRVDERGAGSITMFAADSTFQRVGADGIELDEGQDGDVTVHVASSYFIANGNYCDPAILSPLLPSPDEAEFEDGAMAEDAIPGPVTDAPDATCIEREVDLYDSGSVEAYEFGLDLDDGFDIDEAGAGSIFAVVNDTLIRDNRDEGLDFDEEDAGGIHLTLNGNAAGNTDDGVKLSEEDAGDVTVEALHAVALDNGGKGFVFEEEGDGDLTALMRDVTAAGNDDGDKTGIEVVQEDAGTGTLTVVRGDIADGIDAEGVTVTEE
ncbi:hypothetical protein [Pseudaestuariivita sp.]|uniref:hypothetical protein n=1 Tax=Pseudaestuariivita sp. TaxID=2211669 RepID=UPI004059C944